VITKINGAASAVLGVNHLGRRTEVTSLAPPAHCTDASGPLPLCVA
jgi:hypothetical protein